jgi:ribonuclease Z
LINHNERLFLIDCAEGTQLQLRKYHIRIQRIQHIFISHLHGDHFFGLIGLISTMHLLGRNKDLHVYGPQQLEDILNIQLEASQTELVYPFHFHPINPQENNLIYEDEKLTISTIPLNHRIPTCGFLFREKQGNRKLNKEVISKINIPVHEFSKIKNGADYTDENGKIYKNIELTKNPDIPRSYAYCSDTSYFEPVIPIVKNVDLLYHEATFMHEKAEVAAEKFHSTSVEAATIAKKANARKLVIGHFSTRYDDVNLLLEEARNVFPNTELARDGREIEVG